MAGLRQVEYPNVVRALLALALSVVVLAALGPLTSAHAQDADAQDANAQVDGLELPPELEAHALRLNKQIMCPVCPGETLQRSQATLAKQMRAIVRQRLAEGQSPQQITDYFVSVYGQSVLAQPPTSGIGLAVWLVPPLAIAAGAVALLLVLRSMRRRAVIPTSEGPEPAPAGEGGLQAYLRAVDEEMGGDTKPRGV